VKTPCVTILLAALAAGAASGAPAQERGGTRLRYAAVTLAQPQHGETVHDNLGRVEVAVQLVPALDASAGHRIRMGVDGKLRPGAWTSERFTLTGIDRGAHSLQAVIVDRDGRPLAASDEITFHMWQASRLFPGRKGAGR